MTTTSLALIIPLFNKAGTIERAIRSALNQHTPFDEIIVVDDASTDHSVRIVQDMPEASSVILLRHNANKGPGAARNTGLAASKSDFVCFLDADDFMAPDATGSIQRALRSAANPAMLIFQVKEVGTGIVRPRPPQFHLVKQITPKLTELRNWAAAMVDDALFCSGGNAVLDGPLARSLTFDEQARNFEDWDYYFRYCRAATANHRRIVFLEAVGTHYTADDPNSLSRRRELPPASLSPPKAALDRATDRRVRRLVIGIWLCHSLPRATWRQKAQVIQNLLTLNDLPRPFLRHALRALAATALGPRMYDQAARTLKRLRYG